MQASATSWYFGGFKFRRGASTKINGENYKQIKVWRVAGGPKQWNLEKKWLVQIGLANRTPETHG
jgi:hypothetical protein